MIRIPPELEGARLNVTRTAELVHMNIGHFRRLIRRGILPSPKKTNKGMPYFEYDLICQIANVLKSGIGANGEEICFYRRKGKPVRQRGSRSRQQNGTDEYVESLIEGCRQLGADESRFTASAIKAALIAEFRDDRPPLNQAMPAVVRRLFDAQG